MYDNKAKRDKKGRIVSQDFQSKDLPSTRIQPDRRWFGNTRVIGQKQLDDFREEMAAKMNDPYAVLLKEKKLPLSLVEDPEKKKRKGGKMARASLVAVEPFAATFGAKKTRKRPKLEGVESYAALVQTASKKAKSYEEKEKDSVVPMGVEGKVGMRDPVFEKGQSRRIWGELYKVVDSSDVLLQVLDARDPMGTRCKHLESHLKYNHRQKHLILVLNKCDLVRCLSFDKYTRYIYMHRGDED
jgi:nuclear GTP-binding protein